MQENLQVMGSAGQSSSTAFQTVYGMAAVLFVLVLLAGVLMISGSMNSNLAQRTQFFGMMRCIGMSKRQVIRFVRLEAPQLVQDGGAHRPCAGHFGQLDDLRRAAVRHRRRVCGNASLAAEPCGPVRRCRGGCGDGAAGCAGPGKAGGKGLADGGGLRQHPECAGGPCGPCRKGPGGTGTGRPPCHRQQKELGPDDRQLCVEHCAGAGLYRALCSSPLLLPSLVPWQPDVLYNGYGNAQVLPGSMTRTLLEVPGVAHAWGCTGLVDTPASSDKGNVDHVIFCSYDDYMLESSRSVVVRGRMPGAGNEVMTIYNKNNPMQIGDVITVNGVPLTIVGAFSEGTFPDDVTLIAPEALFRQVAGDQNYNMVGVQLDRTADEDTLFTLADLATDDVIMQDLRESNRQDRGTYYAVRIVLYGFLAIIGGISLLNIVNSISMSVSARARQYGAMRAVGMEDVQLCRMIAAEAGTYAASGLLVGVAAGLVLHRALYTRLITHYFGVVWRVPFGLLAVLCLFVAGAAALAVHGPVKRLQAMPVTAAINEL